MHIFDTYNCDYLPHNIFSYISFLPNQFSVKYRFPFPILRFYCKITKVYSKIGFSRKCTSQHFYLRFIQILNIPITLKLQVAVRGVGVAPSVAVHVTGLVPTGKEPWYWLLLSDRVIWLLAGDIAVHVTVAVPQLSWAVGWVNATNTSAPVVDVWLMSCCGHCIKVGGVVSGAVKKRKKNKSRDGDIISVVSSSYQWRIKHIKSNIGSKVFYMDENEMLC